MTQTRPVEDESVNARLRVSTAVSRAGEAARGGRRSPTTTCADPRHYELADWGGEGSFGQAIADHRSALFEEFDRVSDRHALGLVRSYLFYGFAPEADAVLLSLKIAGPEAEAALAVSDLMKGQPMRWPQGAESHPGCGGIVGLLGLLTRSPSQGFSDDLRALVLELSKLPQHLQRLLGPRIVASLNAAGYEDIADVFHANILKNLNGEAVGEFGLRTARNAGGKATEPLLSKITSGSVDAPEALARLLEEQVSAGQMPDLDHLDLAAAYAVELEGSDLATRLGELRIIGLAIRAEYDQALSAASRIRGGSSEKADLLARIAEISLHASQPASAAAFVHALTESGMQSGLSETQRIALAERMLEDGLPDLARAVLFGVNLSAQDNSRNARLLSQTGAAGESLAMLSRLPAEEAEPHRTELAEQVLGPEAALDSAGAEVSDAQKDELAWKAGRVSELREAGPRKAVGEVLSSDAPQETGAAQAAALRETSASLRAAISALLSSEAQ